MKKSNRHLVEYYKITADNPPSKLLIKALGFVKNKNKAIDIGGGALKDTKYLLDQGFNVNVVDKSELMAIEAKKILSKKIHYAVSAFANFDFPENTFDLAAAMYSLSFNPPETFIGVIEKIKKSLVQGGIFCGQLFGVRDEWSNRKEMTFLTKIQVQELFSDMEIISFEEEDADGTIANGTKKHWHVFHIIAKKV